MNGEPENPHRRAIRAGLAAVALLMSTNVQAGAQEPTREPPPEASAKETIEELVTAPGGVPTESIDPDLAVEMLKSSTAKLEEQLRNDLAGGTYVIDFDEGFEWVRLVSGEWVKGEIQRMRDDVLEFDSDKLSMLSIDFADVTHLYSPRVETYLFYDRVSATGKGIIIKDEVIIETEEGVRIFPRDELQSIIPGGDRERDWWSMKLRFGATFNRGNTDQFTYDINFNTRREDDLTLLDLKYNASFGRTGGEQNVNRHLGELNLKVFVSRRWFVTPAFGQLLNDRFQNIRFRATPAAGAGIHIIDSSKVKWDFQTGLGYQFLRFRDESVTNGDNPQNDVFIPLYTYADFEITGDIDLTLSWRTNLVLTTIGNTNHTGKADLSIEVNSILNFDIAFLYLRTEDPGPPSDPADPPLEQNDYQLIIGVSVELG